MPDGDSIHRSGAVLRTALVGRPLRRFDAPRLFGPPPTIGRLIEKVTSHGKHLEVAWDDGIILHTHMRISGSWQLYRVGEKWRKSTEHMRVAIEVPGWVAVCFDAPIVETYREYDQLRHPGFGRLAPDLCRATDDELFECVRRVYEYDDPTCPISEVLLDQHVARGVGNVYRSEILWACELSPLTPVGELSFGDCRQVINAAARMLRANQERAYRVTAAEIPGGLAVYGRNGTRCARCGDTVLVKRIGQFERLLYFCPGCQPRHQQRGLQNDLVGEPEMDSHPAAAIFNADLPWRRDSVTG
ncbi:MAG: hypothetical protein HY826_05150 [Actinobacteria bacterium]|nr:hypothetical protein [Actinomycetota bacterium]